MTNANRRALAERAARTAGRFLLEKKDIHVTRKALNDYVTDMDVANERLLRDLLLGECPEDGFFGEETGDSARGGGRWIVDPIDGTTNFIRGIPYYTVSVAYQSNGELLCGAVYCPPLDEMFSAARGMGATLNGAPIRVSRVDDPASAIIGMSFAHRDPAAHRRMLRVIDNLSGANDLRRMGSAALDLCYVACGRTDAFVEPVLNLYDIAAGVQIVREAGGVVSGWPGGAPAEVSGDVLAGNGLINGWVADAVSRSAGE